MASTSNSNFHVISPSPFKLIIGCVEDELDYSEDPFTMESETTWVIGSTDPIWTFVNPTSNFDHCQVVSNRLVSITVTIGENVFSFSVDSPYLEFDTGCSGACLELVSPAEHEGTTKIVEFKVQSTFPNDNVYTT